MNSRQLLPALLAALLGLTTESSFAAPAGSRDLRIAELARSSSWRKLLHFQPSLPFGTRHSQLDGAEFFFSPQGGEDPEAELRATLEAFTDPAYARKIGRLKQHPQCAFPERYRFLKKELALDTKDIVCEKLDEFLAKFKARSATLVYSSAYPNNPGSMFGHTFLRINSKAEGDQKKLDLLDQGISFAAYVPPDANQLDFILKGLMGGYPGQFSILPYYVKVNEYVSSESRDLWEYDLDLTPEQTERLLRHAWEVETNSYFDYYFIDENCAYQLLALLEVARPDWTLTDFGFHVIPADTIKKLASVPGAVTGVRYRPSLRKQLLARYESLDPARRKEFFAMTSGEADPASAVDIPTADAALTWFHYLKQKNEGKLKPEQQALFSRALLRRSQLGLSTESAPEVAPPARPEDGHHPYRVGLTGGAIEATSGARSPYSELSFKFAYHDLLNDDTGYMPFSHFDFPGMTLRYDWDARRLRIEEIKGVAITSLFPVSFLETRASWKLDLRLASPKDYGCRDCSVFHAEFGNGLAFSPGTDRAILYGMLSLPIEFGSSIPDKFRLIPRLELAAIANPWRRYKTRLSAAANADLFQTDRRRGWFEAAWEHSFGFGPSFEVRGAVSWIPGAQRDGRVTLNYYY